MSASTYLLKSKCLLEEDFSPLLPQFLSASRKVSFSLSSSLSCSSRVPSRAEPQVPTAVTCSSLSAPPPPPTPRIGFLARNSFPSCLTPCSSASACCDHLQDERLALTFWSQGLLLGLHDPRWSPRAPCILMACAKAAAEQIYGYQDLLSDRSHFHSCWLQVPAGNR